MKRILFILFCILVLYSSASAEYIYISQTAQSGDNGTDCANSHGAAWFNTAGNWGGGAGEIDPGDTVYLCDNGGNFTTSLTTQTGGTEGNIITITPGAGESPVITNVLIIGALDSYVTIDGLTFTMDKSCTNPGLNAINAYGGDYITLQNNTITGTGYWAITFYVSGSDRSDYATISHNTFNDIGGGVAILSSSSGDFATNFLIEYNEFTGLTDDSGCSGASGDGFQYTGTDHVFKGNYLYSLGTIIGEAHVDAFQCRNDRASYDCQDVTFDSNYIWLEFYATDDAFTKGWETGGGVNGLTAKNNIIHAWYGLHSGGDKSTNFTVINNTFIGWWGGGGSYGSGLALDLEAGGTNTVTNNIFIDWPYRHLNYSDPEPTSSYNLFYNMDESTPDCSDSDADCQQTGDQYDANPLFTSFGTSDFTLSFGSPAIGAGADLGNSLLYGLDPASTWPDSVLPVDQDDYNDGTDGWEIGAYVYGDTVTSGVLNIPGNLSISSGSLSVH